MVAVWGPNPVSVRAASSGKTGLVCRARRIYSFCSAKHLPGYLQLHAELCAAGIDEDLVRECQRCICDGGMGSGSKRPVAKVRMLADGDAAFTKSTGLTLDLTGKGLGYGATAIQCW